MQDLPCGGRVSIFAGQFGFHDAVRMGCVGLRAPWVAEPLVSCI